MILTAANELSLKFLVLTLIIKFLDLLHNFAFLPLNLALGHFFSLFWLSFNSVISVKGLLSGRFLPSMTYFWSGWRMIWLVRCFKRSASFWMFRVFVSMLLAVPWMVVGLSVTVFGLITLWFWPSVMVIIISSVPTVVNTGVGLGDFSVRVISSLAILRAVVSFGSVVTWVIALAIHCEWVSNNWMFGIINWR